MVSIYQNNGEGQRAVIRYESWWKLFPFKQSKGLLALLKSMAAYGVWFTVVGTVPGMVGGALGGTSTNITGASNDNGALPFFLTAPIGDFLGILYGIYKKLTPEVSTCGLLFAGRHCTKCIGSRNH